MKPLLITVLASAPILAVAQPTDSAAPAAPETAPVVHADPFGFPAASEGLIIHSPDDEAGPSLEVIARTYGDLTSQAVIYSDETKTFLASTHLNMNGKLEVPKERVQTTIEAILASHHFLMVPLTDEAPRLIEIVSMQTGSRSSVREHAVFVPADHIDAAADHPAILCSTVLDLENADARQLGNSLRAMITDPNTTQVIAGGNSNTMVLTAPGAQLATLAKTILEVDAASAPAQGGSSQ